MRNESKGWQLGWLRWESVDQQQSTEAPSSDRLLVKDLREA